MADGPGEASSSRVDGAHSGGIKAKPPVSIDSGPPGHSLRRAATVSDTQSFRRRPVFGHGSPSSFTTLRRTSSSFSEISHEARDTINPTLDTTLGGDGFERHERSRWDSLPLAFALLPAVGGILVQGGNALVTDLMLLLLGALFLNWSVTQPWVWYYSAQQVRVSEELRPGMVIEEDSDDEASAPTGGSDSPTESSPSKLAKNKTKPTATASVRGAQAREAALKELQQHELLALISCFVFPMLGAYLLHAIRGQLTRPSEGLVSNYNLTIFVLGAEARPLRHLIKLVKARTLHLQRIVHENPYTGTPPTASPARSPSPPASPSPTVTAELADLTRRLADLDARTTTATAAEAARRGDPRRDRDALVRDVRAQMQPELDALARALRRAHKQHALLAAHVEARFRAAEQRADDALALAVAAASKRRSWAVGAVFARLLQGALAVLLLPAQAMLWPAGALRSLVVGRGRAAEGGGGARGSRSGGGKMAGRERSELEIQRVARLSKR